MRRVKKCKTCGCLFICNKFKFPDCYQRKYCECNNCQLKYSRHPILCDITIIKSGDKEKEL